MQVRCPYRFGSSHHSDPSPAQHSTGLLSSVFVFVCRILAELFCQCYRVTLCGILLDFFFLVFLCLSFSRSSFPALAGLSLGMEDADWVDAAPTNPPPSSSSYLASRDHSSLIASKLLQGWTLLAESCPQCLTPLVRNRQKQVYCVSCSQWLLTQDQLALKLAAQHVHENSPPPSTPPQQQQQQPSSKVPTTHMRVASLRDDASALDERSPKRLACTDVLPGTSVNMRDDANLASVAGPADRSIPNLPEVESTDFPSTVLSNTISTLFQKLEELRQSIAACHDVRELNQLLGALGESMQAIQRTKDLLHAWTM
uniref:Uncharacterized protein n=1 Tax=Physcomitrium patens TaxID=3218 RepID=A0A2K1K4M8_PHYPA|nr:hypothetical protein PHYPA_013210 [Physcomitrium patens]